MAAGDYIQDLWGYGWEDPNQNLWQNPDAGWTDPNVGWAAPTSDNTGVNGGATWQNPVEPQVEEQPSQQSVWGDYASKLEGYDASKMASGHSSPKYAFGQVMSQFDPKGGITQAMLDKLNSLGMGTVTGDIGGDKIYIGGNVDPRFEGITSFDVIRDLENGGAWQWSPTNQDGGSSSSQPSSLIQAAMSANQAAGQAAPNNVDPFAAMGGGVQLPDGGWVPKDHPLAQQAVAQTTSGGGTTASGSSTTTTASDGLPVDNKAALMQLLRNRMAQDLNIDPNDPIIRGQSDAYNAKAERARRNYLADVAESSSPYATGRIRNEARMTGERLGQDTAEFQSQLMGRELLARRQEIQQAIDSMGNLLTEGERQALQRELAQADNALRRYGIDTQNAQYYAGLSQADKHFYDQLSQAERLALLDNSFRNAQLGQQDTQFRDTLGFNTADRQAYWDAVRRGMI